MNANYTFNTADQFKRYLLANHKESARELYCVFTRLQAQFKDDKIIAHNICVLAAQGEQPYMIETILLNEYASV